MKLFELMLYIALLAFIFSGYVVFAGNTSQYIGDSLTQKKTITIDSLVHEYLRWSLYKDIVYKESEMQYLLSTTTINRTLSRLLNVNNREVSFKVDSIPYKYVYYFSVTTASTTTDSRVAVKEREYTILMP